MDCVFEPIINVSADISQLLSLYYHLRDVPVDCVADCKGQIVMIGTRLPWEFVHVHGDFQFSHHGQVFFDFVGKCCECRVRLMLVVFVLCASFGARQEGRNRVPGDNDVCDDLMSVWVGCNFRWDIADNPTGFIAMLVYLHLWYARYTEEESRRYPHRRG